MNTKIFLFLVLGCSSMGLSLSAEAPEYGSLDQLMTTFLDPNQKPDQSAQKWIHQMGLLIGAQKFAPLKAKLERALTRESVEQRTEAFAQAIADHKSLFPVALSIKLLRMGKEQVRTNLMERLKVVTPASAPADAPCSSDSLATPPEDTTPWYDRFVLFVASLYSSLF